MRDITVADVSPGGLGAVVRAMDTHEQAYHPIIATETPIQKADKMCSQVEGVQIQGCACLWNMALTDAGGSLPVELGLRVGSGLGCR